MKVQKHFLLFLILLFTFQVSFAQEQKAVLVDSANQLSCEDLLSRLDFLSVELNKTSDSVTYVAIHGGLNSIDNNFYKKFIESYSRHRRLDKNRFVILTTKGTGDFKIDFWLSKKGEKPLLNEEKFDYRLSKDKVKHYFAEESFEIMKIDGKPKLVGNCPACCIQNVDFGLLGNFLENNPDFDARIIVYNKTNRKQFNRFARFISDNAKNFEIQRTRLKIIYGGRREGLYVWNENMASLEVYLVRKNKKT